MLEPGPVVGAEAWTRLQDRFDALADGADVAVQGTGLPPRELGQKYTNTDYTFVDDTDIFDIWRVLVTAKMKFRGAYDLGQLIDTRERRQIVGDFTYTLVDPRIDFEARR